MIQLLLDEFMSNLYGDLDLTDEEGVFIILSYFMGWMELLGTS